MSRNPWSPNYEDSQQEETSYFSQPQDYSQGYVNPYINTPDAPVFDTPSVQDNEATLRSFMDSNKPPHLQNRWKKQPSNFTFSQPIEKCGYKPKQEGDEFDLGPDLELPHSKTGLSNQEVNFYEFMAEKPWEKRAVEARERGSKIFRTTKPTETIIYKTFICTFVNKDYDHRYDPPQFLIKTIVSKAEIATGKPKPEDAFIILHPTIYEIEKNKFDDKEESIKRLRTENLTITRSFYETLRGANLSSAYVNTNNSFAIGKEHLFTVGPVVSSSKYTSFIKAYYSKKYQEDGDDKSHPDWLRILNSAESVIEQSKPELERRTYKFEADKFPNVAFGQKKDVFMIKNGYYWTLHTHGGSSAVASEIGGDITVANQYLMDANLTDESGAEYTYKAGRSMMFGVVGYEELLAPIGGNGKNKYTINFYYIDSVRERLHFSAENYISLSWVFIEKNFFPQ